MNPTGQAANGKADVWTVLKIIRWTTGFLTEKGVSTPRLDAEVLLADLLGLSRVDLYLNYDRPLNPEELAGYRDRVRRRAAREPVAYIIGVREFFSLEFEVGPEVLIPRPETEHLVEEALALVQSRWPDLEGLQAADLGTGSGAVAVVLAARLDTALIWALDVSEKALERAQVNARRHGSRITFLQGDLYEPLAGRNARFHLILANLPYVPEYAFADMDPEVLKYEPRSSLHGGKDGLDLIERAVAGARQYLAPDGALLLEIWPSHVPSIRTMAEKAGFPTVRAVKDLAGHDRIVVLDNMPHKD